ncbi:MAG: LLM class flavin-dependent oxidoreductase, partial [Chloroflexota bacterium]|nr:LLM class flavin-dependent oxidoreductase [Chloroflexota bacterium]
LVEAEEGLTWERWRAIFGAAESLGFESIWISDHLASPWLPDRRGLEAWVALTVAAAETSRVRLGSLVSPATFRQPGLLGRIAASVQALSGGRLTVGLGLGWNAAEHQALGIPFPRPAERARLLARTIAAVRGAAPVLVGGGGTRRTLPIVAQYADEWNLTTASAEVYAERSAVLARLCARTGRDPCAIRRSVAVGYLTGRDAEDITRRARRMQGWVPPLAAVPLHQVPVAARAMGWVVGTPAEMVQHLRRLRAAGIDRVMLGHYDQADLDVLDLVAREIMPHLVDTQ